MALRLTVEPAQEPITTAEAKAHLRVSHSSDDTLIDALVTAARKVAENELGRSLLTQTWVKTLDGFQDAIELPYPPIQAVSSIDYVDDDGATQRLSSSSYAVDISSEPGWIMPAYGYDWPSTREEINAVTVTYTAGYASAADVPQPIKHWILLMVGHYYENREASVQQISMTPLPFVAALLDPFRLPRVA